MQDVYGASVKGTNIIIFISCKTNTIVYTLSLLKHALWLSTAIISVCCPAVVILSFSLTKYVRRANLADAGGRENDKQADKKPPATAPNNDKDGPPQKKRRAWHVFTVSGENVVRPP